MNNVITYAFAKGQLISKGLFGVFKSTNTVKMKKFVRISALASKKRSNQKKTLYYTYNN